MHRSGTSALAGVLGLCGLTAPKTLVPSSEANAKGFWESEPIKSLDELALKTLELNWHSLGQIAAESFGTTAFDALRRRALATLTDEFPKRSDILVKEPRLCRTLPLWAPAFDRSARQVAYAFTVRNPAEVAKSLAQRNHLPLHHGLLLWARYSLDGERHTRGKRRAFLSYPQLIGNWQDQIGRLIAELSLPIDLDSVDRRQVEQYVTPELRHHAENDEAVLASNLRHVADTYQILLGWSEGRAETNADHEQLDSLRSELDSMVAPVAEAFESSRLERKRLSSTRALLDKTQADLAKTQHALRELDGLRESLSEHSTALAALGKAQEDRRALEESLKQSMSMVAELSSRLESARSDAAELVRRHEEERSRIEVGYEERIGEAHERVTTLEQALADAVTTMQLQAKERAELVSKHAQATAEAAQRQARERAQLVSKHEHDFAEAARRYSEDRVALVAKHEEERQLAAEELSESERSLEQARRELQRETAAREATGAELAELKREHQALDEELIRVKHKYRAAQHDTRREKKAHAGTRSQLAEVQRKLSIYENSAVWALYLALARQWTRIARFAGKLGGGNRKRRREQLDTISNSGLFDPAWYLKQYPDVAAAGADPLMHFFDTGWREGRDPGPQFATSDYLKANADVAGSGVNPLLHYVEFGKSEGRGIRAHHEPGEAPMATAEVFGDAAPVFRGHGGQDSPTRWRRSYRLPADDPRLVMAGDVPVGLVRDSSQRQAVESAFARLASLSGVAGGDPQTVATTQEADFARLADAWYASGFELRTRWDAGGRPVVVRAFQHDPDNGDALALVGEGLIESALDTFDASLADPFFPVLFVFAEPDGELLGVRLLPFPSLSRGGLHYPELIAGSADDPDPLAHGASLAEALARVRSEPERLVTWIAVDVNGADGTSPLFDPRFRHWLDKVAGVTAAAAEGSAGPAAELIAASSRSGDADGGCLLLACDMVPTLSVLCALRGHGEPVQPGQVLSLLVAGVEPSQPVTLVAMPQAATAALSQGAAGFAGAWPRFGSPAALPEAIGPAAIRLGAPRAPTESELLVPAMAPALTVPRDPPAQLTWIVAPQEWRSQHLLHSLRALSTQWGAENHHLAIIGDIDPEGLAFARRLFGERISVLAAPTTLIGKLQTPLAGYVGSGVILHDQRTAAYLAGFLDDPAVVSAACPLISTQRRGKGWQVSVTDGGTIAGWQHEGTGNQSRFASLFLRSCFPVVKPPQDLWIARSASVKKWLGDRPPAQISSGIHLCTALITASHSGSCGQAPEIHVPPVAEDCSARTRTLMG